MHKDAIGNDINIDDIVAYGSHNRLKIGTVQKLTPKMVMVIPAGKQYWDRKYPYDVIKITDNKGLLYIIKNNG